MPLSDVALRRAKPRARPFKLSDAGGLFVLVKPNGSKLWRLAYRFGGRQKLLALGAYPVVTLADARAARDRAKARLAQGTDPGHERKIARLATGTGSGESFSAIAKEWLRKREREGAAPVTLDKARWLLGLADGVIGVRPCRDITPLELLALFRVTEGKGHYETARRLRSTCGRVFRYAVAIGRADRDPTADLRGALVTPKVRHRAAIVEPKAIGGLLRAIDGYDGQRTTQAALRLMALVFVRPGELRAAEWTEFALADQVWLIPAQRMKMRRTHRVPLSRQALAVLRDLQGLTGHGRFLFPGIRTPTRPMSENTLNAALRRLGYSADDMTAHGFRAMAATRLNEMGRWGADAIERQLAHQEPNEVRRAYTHAAEYWDERVRMMQAWADYLDRLKADGRLHVLKRRPRP